MEIELVGWHVLDGSIKVHSILGPGLLESAYKSCLAYELRKRGLRVETEVPLPVVYDGVKVDAGYRIDLLVEGCVVVELKAVERILPVHDAQLLSHLKLSGHKLGLRINFNVVHLRDGIKRMVNDL
jgi:GxxExxY protein